MITKLIRKYTCFVIALIVLMPVISGCGVGEKKTDSGKPKDDRTVLTIGNLDSNEISGIITQYVDEFNKTNENYRIEVKDYSDSEDCSTAFNLDVSAGNIPDIIVTDRAWQDRLIYTGILIDLQPYLDTDTELSQDDFLDSVMSAWREDGKLYYMAMDYYVTVMYGKKDTVGKYSNGWTKKDMIDFAEASDIPLFYEKSKMSIYDQFMVSGYAEFIDWNTGKAKFDTDLFARILKYCNQGVKESDAYQEKQDQISEFKQGKYILDSYSLAQFYDIEDITRTMGSDLCYIGYPNAYRDTSYMQFQRSLGITSKSKYQDAAWQFVRSIFTKRAQYEYCKQTGFFSVRKDVFDMQKKAAMTTESYTDEFETQIDPIDFRSSEQVYTPLSQEEADLAEKLVLSAKHCRKLDKNIDDIVYDEVSAYFNGDCTIDRVGETINSRVETYMNENR